VIDTDFGNGILEYKNGKVEGVPEYNSNNTAAAAPSLNLLEKHVTGHRKAVTEHEHMTCLLELNSKMGEDADANASIRAAFRKDRKAKKRRLGEAAGLGLGSGIELSEGVEEDATLAKRAMEVRRRSRSSGRAHRSEKDKFRSVRGGSIFASQKSLKKKKTGGLKTPIKEKVERKKKTNADGSGKKLVSKQKMMICQKKSESDSKKKSPNGKTSRASPDGGALAALSSFYASDSD